MTDSGPSGENLRGSRRPARHLSLPELEAVIRRADELQARRAEAGDAQDGVAEDEVIHIGQELGLDPVLVRRAINEVRAAPPAEEGVLARVMGPGTVRVARTIFRPAHVAEASLQAYLESSAGLVLQRYLPEGAGYARGKGARRTGRHAGMEVEELAVVVAELDEGSCRVELAADLRESRMLHAWFGGASAAFLALLALVQPGFLALSALTAALTPCAYGEREAGTRERLESLLESWSARP